MLMCVSHPFLSLNLTYKTLDVVSLASIPLLVFFTVLVDDIKVTDLKTLSGQQCSKNTTPFKLSV